jgi:hypothetical protein
MRTTYASKSVQTDGTLRTKRYWYYTTASIGADDRVEIERLPAKELERVVLDGLRGHLSDARWLTDQIKGHQSKTTLVADIMGALGSEPVVSDGPDDTGSEQALQGFLNRIDVQNDRLLISANLAAVAEPDAAYNPIPAAFEIPFQKRQNGRAKPIIIAADNAPQQDEDLIALVADARRWAGELLDGRVITVQQITEREGLRSGSVSRILPLAWLAPDISTAILEGRQPPHLNVKALRALPKLPLDWAKQRRVLGFAQL